MVSDLIDEDSKRWKVDTLKSLFLPFEVERILNIPLSYSLPEDKIIWVGNKRGEERGEHGRAVSCVWFGG